MIYREAYDRVRLILNESYTGWLPEEDFCTFWSQGETIHFNELDGKLSDYARHDPAPPVKDAVTKDIEARLAPFLKPKTIMLTDGIGQLPVLGDDRWGAPRTVAASGYRKKCGGEATPADRRYPVKWAGPTEFNYATSAAFQPKNDTGLWCSWDDNQIKVTPLTIHAVEITYFKPPTPPTPDTLGNTIPWGLKDCEVIISKVVEKAGVMFNATGVAQYGMTAGANEK